MRLYRQGSTLAEITSVCQCSLPAVYRVLRAHDCPLRQPQPRPIAEQVAQMYAAGVPLQQIRQTCRCGTRRLARIIRELPPRGRPRQPFDESAGRIVELYAAGLTWKEIRRLVGCSTKMIARAIKAANLAPRPRRSVAKTDRNAEIIERRRSGETLARIAADYGISRQRASQIVARAAARQAAHHA